MIPLEDKRCPYIIYNVTMVYNVREKNSKVHMAINCNVLYRRNFLFRNVPVILLFAALIRSWDQSVPTMSYTYVTLLPYEPFNWKHV